MKTTRRGQKWAKNGLKTASGGFCENFLKENHPKIAEIGILRWFLAVICNQKPPKAAKLPNLASSEGAMVVLVI